jgi:hypothetical protein
MGEDFKTDARASAHQGQDTDMISHSGRKRAAISKSKPHLHRVIDHDYESLLVANNAAFSAATAGGSQVFTTDAEGLWDLYLKNLPESERQFHNCHCCRRFIERFGLLVVIGEDGRATPAMWAPDVPDLYGKSFSAMFYRVKTARVTGVFLCKEAVWGVPATPGWTHLSVTPPPALVYHERALTAGQAMAAKKQDFITVSTALSEFTAPMLDQALRLLEADALARSEKFIGPAKWLRTLHDRPKGRLGENVLWRAIASAPEGFCHPKSSVLGPLLEDIRAGKSTDEIARSFEAMMHPLRYQRPQAAPAAQNIKAAEALVEKLGLTRSLERRFARLNEVPKVWEPRVVADAKSAVSGVFGHLKAKSGDGAIKAVDIPESVLTAEKFIAKALPLAERMEFFVPSHSNFIALLTAEHSDAPIIHKWGNPFSWYIYHGGSAASQWRIAAGWASVSAIVRSPPMWAERPLTQWGDGYVLALKGALDTRDNSGNALFPETLIPELFGARSVVEAYSRSAKIGGRDATDLCCGHFMGQGDRNLRVRVWSNGGWIPYLIDRWG